MVWKVHIERQPWILATKFYVVDRDHNGDGRVLRVSYENIKRGGLIDGPSIELSDGEDDQFLQAFMDAAWEIGIRPTALEDQRNQVAAMGEHLADLRRVSFKLLKIEP